MKILKRLPIAVMLTLSAVLIQSCGNSVKPDTPDPDNPGTDCYVQLFDGDNFTDESVTIKSPGEFSDLSNLLGSHTDWTDEADSFKVGKNTTVRIYTEKDFKGESKTCKGGNKISSEIKESYCINKRVRNLNLKTI